MDHAAAGGDTRDRLGVLAESDVALEAGLHADHRADEQSDDAVVGDDKADVLFLPGPAGEGDGEKIEAKRTQPDNEERMLVDEGVRDLGVEPRFGEGGHRTGQGNGGEQNEGEIERAQPVDQPPDRRLFLPPGDHRLADQDGIGG